MSEKPPDTRIFKMTKTEASMLSAFWPRRQELVAALMKVDGEIADMRQEMAERLTGVAGFTITEKMIGNMDWGKREATVTLPPGDDGENGKPVPVNRLPAEKRKAGV